MRILPVLLAVAVPVTISTAALAGTLTLVEGKPQWQSTLCTEPAAPPSLLQANPETRADNMNVLMRDFNVYAAAMQQYMDCISNEAQSDSNLASQTIIQSAQTDISGAQQKVNGMRESLRGRQ